MPEGPPRARAAVGGSPADSRSALPAAAQTLLAFDYGERRVGVALGNTLTASARALEVIDVTSQAALFERIGLLVGRWGPDGLVVGRPTHPDGQAHAMTARCEKFARQLHGRTRLPVTLVDERYSSVEAASDPDLRAGRAPLDAEAAAVILRQYLHEQRPT